MPPAPKGGVPNPTAIIRLRSVAALSFAALILSACEGSVTNIDGERLDQAADASRVGYPCVPSDEANPDFPGFDKNSITVESGNPSCGGGVCIVDRFQGRVTCADGQPAPAACIDDAECADGACVDGLCTSGCFAGDLPVTVPVCGQCSDRTTAEAVHCSCMCGPPPSEDPDPTASYCSCPGGFTCQPVARWGELAGSYCVRLPATDDPTCGTVGGFWAPRCHGVPAP